MDALSGPLGWIVVAVVALIFVRSVIVWTWPDSGIGIWLSSFDGDGDGDGWGGGDGGCDGGGGD